MLEVKKLSKIYKTKNGADVKALDGVSLQFPETGMVFLLGKSGSGKSTLLNICGGLDAPTDGEIIVKGRSSKNFTQSDFDSYRNTFVGFIFQEYNILNEFSVEDNIALALELQGKPKDKKAVSHLLNQVDLEGYAKRKPNTLSGGQKQRVAIARALVKSPEIIMADEPTGALDSNTGKQVFETLKKLSQDKLVLVVSHDREFAEQYGDRIIELQDGKVLSDVTKTREQQKEVSRNIQSLGNVLCIKKGTNLNEQDFDAIKSFLNSSNTDVIIANSEKDVNAFKKINRITDEGSREVFCDTNEEVVPKKEYGATESRFIRSKLPAKHAIHIGISSLKSKPIRLFFTILLCAIAFTLFGLLSTMSFYDSEATFKQTMQDSTRDLLRVSKSYQGKEVSYQNGEVMAEYDVIFDTRFSSDDLDALSQQFGNGVFGGVPVYITYNVRSNTALYWNNYISTMAYLQDDNSLRANINGAYPKTEDEICISSYTAEVLVNCKTYDDQGNTVDVMTQEELIGKKINFGGTNYKIVGIVDSGVVPDKYDVLKTSEEQNEQLAYQLRSELEDGLFFVAFVSQERLEKIAAENKPYAGEDLRWYRRLVLGKKGPDGNYELPEWSNASYDTFSEEALQDDIVFLNGNKTTLADNEVVLTHRLFAYEVYELYSNKIETLTKPENWAQIERLQSSMELCNQLMAEEFSRTEMLESIKRLVSAMKKDGIVLSIGTKLFVEQSQTAIGDIQEFSVVGVVIDESVDVDRMYVSETVCERFWDEQKVNIEYYSVVKTNYQEDKDAVYGVAFLPYDYSEEQTELYWNMYNDKTFSDDGSRIRPTGNFVDKVAMVDDMVKSMSQVFLYVGLVLAVFAALLLSNFISVSISQKKKEIGILRAVGARSLDVFKIFFSESFFISVICVILAVVASCITCNLLNQEVAIDLGASIFVFGLKSLLVLIGIALATTVIATFLPVWNAAKKKPVESIRSL